MMFWVIFQVKTQLSPLWWLQKSWVIEVQTVSVILKYNTNTNRKLWLLLKGFTLYFCILFRLAPCHYNSFFNWTLHAVFEKNFSQNNGSISIIFFYHISCIFFLFRFRERLKEISKDIKARNSQMSDPYPYLDPAEVPNAISI